MRLTLGDPVLWLSAAIIVVLSFGFGQQADGDPLPDPTEPPGGRERQRKAEPSEEADPSWRVASIIRAGSRRLAVINGSITREGEVVSGARVAAITSAGVIMEYQGKRFTVRVVPGGISKRTGSSETKEEGR